MASLGGHSFAQNSSLRSSPAPSFVTVVVPAVLLIVYLTVVVPTPNIVVLAAVVPAVLLIVCLTVVVPTVLLYSTSLGPGTAMPWQSVGHLRQWGESQQRRDKVRVLATASSTATMLI